MKGLVLIVDDDDGVRITIEHVLTAAGYKVASAIDGAQALLLFEKLNPEVVITDLIMPVQDGIETIAQLKERRPNLKIIAMSGGARIGNDNVLQKAKDLGADHIIAKPFESAELTELVQRSIGAHP